MVPACRGNAARRPWWGGGARTSRAGRGLPGDNRPEGVAEAPRSRAGRSRARRVRREAPLTLEGQPRTLRAANPPRPAGTRATAVPSRAAGVAAGAADRLLAQNLAAHGNTLAASTGASLADLMARMGHGSTRAALIYQHTAQQRDRAITDALSLTIDRARNGHAGPEQ